MPSTEKTGYLNLTQYQADDITSWLQDYNSDMRKIDTGVQANHAEIATNMESIATLSSTVTTQGNDIASLQTTSGSQASSITDLTANYNVLNRHVSDLQTELDTTNTTVEGLGTNIQQLGTQVTENTNAISSNTVDINNLKTLLNFKKITDFELQNISNGAQHTFSLNTGLYAIFVDFNMTGITPGDYIRPTLNGFPVRTTSTLVVADYGIQSKTQSNPTTIYRMNTGSIVTCYVSGTDNFNVRMHFLTQGGLVPITYSSISNVQASLYKLTY